MFKRSRRSESDSTKGRGRAVQPPDLVVQGLRDRLLGLTSREIRATPTAMLPRVWGVVMDTGRPAGLVTLGAMADGSASLFQGNGWGVQISASSLPGGSVALGTMLATAETCLVRLTPVAGHHLPEIGKVRIVVRTYDGDLATDAVEDDLGYGRHALSTLFHAAQGLTTLLHEKAKPLKQ